MSYALLMLATIAQVKHCHYEGIPSYSLLWVSSATIPCAVRYGVAASPAPGMCDGMMDVRMYGHIEGRAVMQQLARQPCSAKMTNKPPIVQLCH